jgi:hypothetical protein
MVLRFRCVRTAEVTNLSLAKRTLAASLISTPFCASRANNSALFSRSIWIAIWFLQHRGVWREGKVSESSPDLVIFHKEPVDSSQAACQIRRIYLGIET